MREIIVDCFAGGGGASTGIEQALGRSPDIAINHDPEAVAMHAVNHPATTHLCGDVWDVKPLDATRGRPVGLLWASPDCRHFSKAKGGKPVEKRVRSLAWVVVRWAREVQPRVICLENVEEFADWGPLVDGRPCPLRKGFTFRRWVKALEKAGYLVETRDLRACDFGAPTIRKRLFVVARRDGLPAVWPAATHGRGLLPYRTAADCIDWNIPCPSIFDRKKPLAAKTLRRIARGVQRYVVDSPHPFIVPGTEPTPLALPLQESLFTNTDDPASGDHAGVSAFLTDYLGGESDVAPSRLGLHAIRPGAATDVDLVASSLVLFHGSRRDGQPIERPLPTVRAGGMHIAEVRAFLGRLRYEHSLAGGAPVVMIGAEPYGIVDIGMRMLSPRELYRAQGFDDGHVIDVDANGKRLTKEAQVRLCGNSVVPAVARAIVVANMTMTMAATTAA